MRSSRLLHDHDDVFVIDDMVDADELRVVLGARALQHAQTRRKGPETGQARGVRNDTAGQRLRGRGCETYPNERILELIDKRAVDSVALYGGSSKGQWAG